VCNPRTLESNALMTPVNVELLKRVGRSTKLVDSNGKIYNLENLLNKHN